MVVADPTPGLFREHMQQEGVDPRYRRGYMDALLDVYLIVKFHNEKERTAYFQEPVPLSPPER